MVQVSNNLMEFVLAIREELQSWVIILSKSISQQMADV